MPRLRDRGVLDEGIIDLPMIWQTDAFALATGYDATSDRYVGLWIPDDKAAAPAATDSLLLVRPDVAAKQHDAESSAPVEQDSEESEQARKARLRPRTHRGQTGPSLIRKPRHGSTVSRPSMPTR